MKKLVFLLSGLFLATSALQAQTTEDVKKYKAQKTHNYGELYFGWNNWSGAAPDVNDATTTELDGWPSTTWGFGFGGDSQLGTGKFSVRYGLQFNWHYFRLKGNTVAFKDTATNGTIFVPSNQGNFKKSVFRMIYLDLPVMFHFYSKPRGEYKGLALGLGGYGGVRIGSSQKSVYDDAFNDNTKDIVNNNFFTNPFRYGAMAQIGYGSFRLTGKMDLNNLFDQGKATPDYKVGSLTLGWVFP
jgi:hypothetical protein